MSKMDLKEKLIDFPKQEDGITNIYSLFQGDTCIYVGQSICLRSRIYQHLADGKEFDGIDYFRCEIERANEAEADEIVSKNPYLNKRLPSNEKYISFSVMKKDIENLFMEKKESIEFCFQREDATGSTKHCSYLLRQEADRIVAGMDAAITKLIA